MNYEIIRIAGKPYIQKVLYFCAVLYKIIA